jgi:hypothetical protein
MGKKKNTTNHSFSNDRVASLKSFNTGHSWFDSDDGECDNNSIRPFLYQMNLEQMLMI